MNHGNLWIEKKKVLKGFPCVLGKAPGKSRLAFGDLGKS